MNRLFIVVVLILAILYVDAEYLAFEKSFNVASDSYVTSLLNDHKWQLASDIYNFSTSHLLWSNEPRIPKIIHHIWIGGELPKRCHKFIESWKAFHPDWTFHLWTEDKINEFELENKFAYNQASNFGEKADIVRYEILYRIGGLYVDTDFECLKAFDDLHHYFEFYSGLAFGPNMEIFNGLIGSAPGNTILRTCIDRIKARKSNNNVAHEIMSRTGPYFFTQCFFDTITQPGDRIVLFPPSFFYPWPGWGKHDIPTDFIKENSMAIHHWHGSWMR